MITEETQTLVQQAQDKKYSDFDKTAKEVLSQKVAQKLAEKGYFDRLDQAKGIFGEAEEKAEEKEVEDEEKKEVEDEEKEEDTKTGE